MMYPMMVCTAFLGASLAFVAPIMAAQPVASQTAGAEAEASVRREAFLKLAEAAFATRDTKAVAALADVDAWRAAGYPELSTLQMFLPPAPIVFEKELTAMEVIYRDGTGRRWRLVLRDLKGELKGIIRADPCPQGVGRGPEFEGREKPTPKVQVWTLLECWPLPK
jgi:hypothetical protein